MTTLGHDVNGRPLRAGDRVVFVNSRRFPWLEGARATVAGPSQHEGYVLTSYPHPLPGYEFCHPSFDQVCRLDDRTDHQPSEFTFDSLMDHLKSGVPA